MFVKNVALCVNNAKAHKNVKTDNAKKYPISTMDAFFPVENKKENFVGGPGIIMFTML